MRLRTFDDGGDIVKGPRRRYQGSMSTSLPADGCGRLYHNRLLPCGVQKESRYGRYGSEKTLRKGHAFGRDKRDPPGASRSFRSRQARPSRRIAQLSVATSATLPAQPHCGRATLSVATSATLPAHHTAPRRGRRGYFACRAVRGEPYVPSRGTGLAGIRPWQP